MFWSPPGWPSTKEAAAASGHDRGVERAAAEVVDDQVPALLHAGLAGVRQRGGHRLGHERRIGQARLGRGLQQAVQAWPVPDGRMGGAEPLDGSLPICATASS